MSERATTTIRLRRPWWSVLLDFVLFIPVELLLLSEGRLATRAGLYVQVLLLVGLIVGVALTPLTYVELGPDELRTRTRAGRSVRIPWSTVQRVYVEHPPMAVSIRVTTADGRTYPLKAIATYRGTRPGAELQLPVIERWWHEHRGREWQPVTNPYATP